MQEILIHLVTLHPYVVYGVIFVIAAVEGPLVSMAGGALLRLGFLSFWPLYIVLMVGDVVADALWYWIGRQFGHRFIKRFGKYFSITEEGFQKVSDLFHRRKHHILIFSKITNGFGFSLVTLITAGIVRIPFGKYVLANGLAQFFWSGLMIGVGYLFSGAYMQVNSLFGKLAVMVCIILVIAAFFGYQRYLKTRATK